jgi:hypothetical protein
LGGLERSEQLMLDQRERIGAQRLNLDEGIDKKAEPLRRRHLARGGVGRGHQAHGLKVGHNISHGGRGNLQRRFRRQLLGGDGGTLFNVVLNQQLKQHIGPVSAGVGGTVFSLRSRFVHGAGLG